MSALTQAIYTLLSSDSTLTDELSTYAGATAIFSGSLAPEDATTAYLLISGDILNFPEDSKSDVISRVTRDIHIYTSSENTLAATEVIVDRTRVLLHRVVLTISGYLNLVTKVTNITYGAAEKDVNHIILTLELLIRSN